MLVNMVADLISKVLILVILPISLATDDRDSPRCTYTESHSDVNEIAVVGLKKKTINSIQNIAKASVICPITW